MWSSHRFFVISSFVGVAAILLGIVLATWLYLYGGNRASEPAVLSPEEKYTLLEQLDESSAPTTSVDEKSQLLTELEAGVSEEETNMEMEAQLEESSQ